MFMCVCVGGGWGVGRGLSEVKRETARALRRSHLSIVNRW